MREPYTLAYAGTPGEYQLYGFGAVSQMRIDPGACSVGTLSSEVASSTNGMVYILLT